MTLTNSCGGSQSIQADDPLKPLPINQVLNLVIKTSFNLATCDARSPEVPEVIETQPKKFIPNQIYNKGRCVENLRKLILVSGKGTVKATLTPEFNIVD